MSDDAADPTAHPDPAEHISPTDEASLSDSSERVVDFSAAVGIAGHEQELLGTADVEDTAPVLHDSHPDAVDGEIRMESDAATRGMGGSV